MMKKIFIVFVFLVSVLGACKKCTRCITNPQAGALTNISEKWEECGTKSDIEEYKRSAAVQADLINHSVICDDY